MDMFQMVRGVTQMNNTIAKFVSTWVQERDMKNKLEQNHSSDEKNGGDEKPKVDKLEMETGECSKTQAPFKVKEMIEIKTNASEIDALNLNQWLKVCMRLVKHRESTLLI